MTLAEFFAACEAHDWYYDMSDDGRVYNRGLANENRLLAEAQGDEVKGAIYDAWKKHYFSGSPWGTERAPRPVLAAWDKN